MTFDKDSLKSHLEALVDPQLAEFSASLIPGTERPLLGVRIPHLRMLAKEIAKGDWRTVLAEALTTDTFEEVMLRGFILGYADMEWNEWIERVDDFKQLIDNWSICDSCCITFTTARSNREKLWPLLRADLASGKVFYQRYAAVMLLSHYMTKAHIERVLDELGAMVPAGYYASIGAAWAVQVCFTKFPTQTLARLKERAFNEDVQRLACKKILESRRTPNRYRTLIRQLGKKKSTGRKLPPEKPPQICEDTLL